MGPLFLVTTKIAAIVLGRISSPLDRYMHELFGLHTPEQHSVWARHGDVLVRQHLPLLHVPEQQSTLLSHLP